MIVQPVRASNGPEADNVGVVSEGHDPSMREVIWKEGAGPESPVAMGPRLLAVAGGAMDEDEAKLLVRRAISFAVKFLLDKCVPRIRYHFDPDWPVG